MAEKLEERAGSKQWHYNDQHSLLVGWKNEKVFSHHVRGQNLTGSNNIKYFSLAATIRVQRPDLFENVTVDASPIPLEPPRESTITDVIEGLGQPMVPKPFPSTPEFDPTNWYTFEKLFIITKR